MYAQFDSTAPVPQPVIGWHDGLTPAAQAVLPANLLELTQAEWDNRLNTPFVSGGALVAPPAPTTAQLLAAAKTAQIATLVAAYNAAIQQPVSYMSTTFQADTGSVNMVAQSLAALTPSGATPTGFYWVDAANNHVAMTLAQLQGLAAAMYAQGLGAFQNLQTRKASVNAATTVPGVQAIVW